LAKLGVRGYQPYERLGLWLRQELRFLVERLLLSDRCLERGVFDSDAVKALVNSHLNEGRNHTYLLLAMLTFEIAQRQFIDGDTVGGYRRGPIESSRGFEIGPLVESY
jgi:hypothetical protein